jgi:hypothetical protein
MLSLGLARVRHANGCASGRVQRARRRTINDDSGAPKASKPVLSKAVSWAEIASLRTKRVGKCPLFFTKVKLTKID